MRGPTNRALVFSVIVHGALAAVAAQVTLRAKPVATAPVAVAPAPIEVVVIDPPAAASAPIEVAFLDSSTPPVPASALPAPPSVPHTPTSKASSQNIAATSSTTTSVTSEGATTTTSTTGEISGTTDHGSGFMHMRGTDLALDGATAERIAESGSHELPAETKVTGKIDNLPGGRGVIYDRVTTVVIEADGTAHFRDKKDIDIHIKLPIPHISFKGMRKDLGKALTDWYADPNAATRFGRSQDLSNINLAAPGACDDWGSIWCDDPLAPGAEKYAREQKKTNGSLLGGAADISAWLQRKYVGDPYASRKLKLLDDTRDERVARGEKFRAQQQKRSAELIGRNLARLAATQMSAIERRASLFELWDECAEGEGPEGEAGQRARAQVIGWIRAHLPKGSPDAFTDEEIAVLAGKRTSKQAFEPY